MLQMFTLLLLLTFPFLSGAADVQTRANGNTQVVVSVYNDAKMSMRDLAGAESWASNILWQAGLNLVWRNCGHGAGHITRHVDCDSPGRIALRIIPGPAHPTQDSIFGVAFLASDGTGKYGDVFYQPAVQLHKELSVKLADVMGGVVAHEIGHLLLGSHAHASAGIMRAQWHGEDLHKLVKGELQFTAEQAAQMRTTVARNQQTLETQLELNQGSY